MDTTMQEATPGISTISDREREQIERAEFEIVAAVPGGCRRQRGFGLLAMLEIGADGKLFVRRKTCRAFQLAGIFEEPVKQLAAEERGTEQAADRGIEVKRSCAQPGSES